MNILGKSIQILLRVFKWHQKVCNKGALELFQNEEENTKYQKAAPSCLSCKERREWKQGKVGWAVFTVSSLGCLDLEMMLQMNKKLLN